MTEKKYFEREDSSNVESSRNMTGRLLLATLLVIIVLLVFLFINSGITARSAGTLGNPEGSFSAATGGSCCSTGNSQSGGAESLAQDALDYYRESGGDVTGIQAVVDDYGCHQEVSLLREGELIKRYSYLGSEFVDITP